MTAGLIVALSTASVTVSPTIAADNPHQAEDTITVTASLPEAASTKLSDPKKKKVVKRKKKRIKTTSKKTRNSNTIATRDEKLSISQVMETLKTSRNLSGKNLSGLQLVGIDLSKCNLKGSDLSHANLERADLEEARLERVNLSGANLKMANLRFAGIPAANLELAIFDGAIWLDGRICAKGSSGQCRDIITPNALP